MLPDTSKPLTTVTLQIRDSGGRSVRTPTGTGPDGSIRNLVRNGKSSSGARAAAGKYSWTLTARTRDGEGALIAADGTDSISGTVVLKR